LPAISRSQHNPEMGGIRFEPDGRVTIVTGTLDYGQGHASAFAQVLVERLALPFERIDLVPGRQRSAAGRRRHRRLTLDHGER
jgi:CO/xanthine dehydrogenase Mo-binding subunit